MKIEDFQLTETEGFFASVLVGAMLWNIVFMIFRFMTGGAEYITFLYYWEYDRIHFGAGLGSIAFFFYLRACRIKIESNHQGIQRFLGTQTGMVWGEGNFHFIPVPFWDIWKTVSIEHFSFTAASQNRTQEGHSVMVFATGTAEPVNVQLLAKLRPEDIKEQIVGFAMSVAGTYIRQTEHDKLLTYKRLDISRSMEHEMQVHELYGLKVKAFITRVVEINPQTAHLFDMLASQGKMETLFASLKTCFPDANDAERYAMYATFTGLTPAVMSHVIHGNRDGNAILLSGNR